MPQVEFFFDCSSPWTYLAFERIGPLCREFNAELNYRPILVGGVFNSVNPSVYENRANPVPAKARYMRQDLQAWADHQRLEINWPKIFPVNSVTAMRTALLANAEAALEPFARAVFRAYWGEGRDISNPEEVLQLAAGVGLNRSAVAEWIDSDAARQQLRDNTAELIERGGFGSPSTFVDGLMYFGNDRMELIRARLQSR